MLINEKKCIGCSKCIPYCPVNAIKLDHKKAVIHLDECVECGVCKRAQVCPTDAIYKQELKWPRTIRNILSDVQSVSEETQVPGRGTEEMKTNELTNRFNYGEAGIGIEVGRPGIATRLSDVEKISQAIASLDIEYEKYNPVTNLMVNTKTGKFKNEVLDERVLSAIIEFKIPNEKLAELLRILKNIEKEIDTVFSLSLICRVEKDNSLPAIEIAKKLTWVSINGKTNLGLGKAKLNKDGE